MRRAPLIPSLLSTPSVEPPLFKMVKSRKIVCQKLSTNFRECTAIVEHELRPLKAGEVLVQTKYVGINASDINYTNGAYLPGVQPPFDCGFEAGTLRMRC